jgi:predicted RNA-binding protein with PUA-like domain
MTPRHWLIKFAPFRTAWPEIVARGAFTLRGIRSPEARKHLNSMRLEDLVLFYQSQQDQAVVGLLKVIREAYPDPTSAEPQWLTCDFAPLQTFPHHVTLTKLKAEPRLTSLPLLNQPRLAVMPVALDQFQIIAEEMSQ